MPAIAVICREENMFKKIVLISTVSSILLCSIYFLVKTHAQTPPISIYGRFYEFDVIADSAQYNLAYFSRTSINNSGKVAFVGKTNSTTVTANKTQQSFAPATGSGI
jgi:hypothetical protein